MGGEMTHPTPAPGDLLAEFNGWRLERKDAKQRPIWFLFRVVSADGLLQYKGAFDGTNGVTEKTLCTYGGSSRPCSPGSLRTLWDSGLDDSPEPHSWPPMR